MKTLEFLGQSKQNVVAIHCLDGKSNTAMLFASIMVVCKVFTRCKDALVLFEQKRCEPMLTSGQRRVLKELERLVKGGPTIKMNQCSVTLNSIVLEPIPLFNKANDGVKPFIEVYSNGRFIASSMKDYASLTQFTNYDGEVVLKVGNIKVPAGGDVTVMVFHARQSLGTFFSGGKTEKIKICQVYFDPSDISSTRTHIKFPTHELDCLGDLERIPADFSVTINFRRGDTKMVKFPYILPEKRKLDLVFQHRSEFEDAMECTGSSEAEPQPKRPPRKEKDSDLGNVNIDEAPNKPPLPKPHSLVDIQAPGVPPGNMDSRSIETLKLVLKKWDLTKVEETTPVIITISFF